MRVAVFVDAGYLYAQGSALISGFKQPRTSIALDARKAVPLLKELALRKADGAKLLRVYWYDGAVGGRSPSPEQEQLAGMDDVKLRLGFINSHGQQKGVDSLIVTDMIELARLQSISDAMLVSGDEDVRIGVQIAQNHGVRVHLVGIEPSRGSQSKQLMHEADTNSELDRAAVSTFLSVRQPLNEASVTAVPVALKGSGPIDVIDELVRKAVGALSVEQLAGLSEFWKSERGIPVEQDRLLLTSCRSAIGTDLSPDQKRHMRSRFGELVRLRLREENQ
jgi:uncharacterized LabA/DUF88 family protein